MFTRPALTRTRASPLSWKKAETRFTLEQLQPAEQCHEAQVHGQGMLGKLAP
jgi:hypothetical protein